LAIISLRAGFLAEEGDDPELARSGDVIRRACAQMERLVNSVLELSRVEAGHLTLHTAPCAFDGLCREVAEPLRGLCNRRGVSLSVETGSDDAALSIDTMKISQVLQNLLGNALKFTPPGGHIG